MIIGILVWICLLLCSSVQGRKCFLCSCEFDWDTNTGSCASPTFLSSCVLTEVQNKYCTITSNYNGNHEGRTFGLIEPDSFQDSHFIQTLENVVLSNSIWVTTINSVNYGCDWDGCNEMSLVEYLPESFQMKIDTTILQSELIGDQLSNRTCLDCGRCIYDLTATLCKIVPCSDGVCFIDEIHNYITLPTNNCTYNFYSTCLPIGGSLRSPSVRIRATYYIDFPSEKQLEIDEVDLYCLKDNCNSITVVESLKDKIQTTIVIPPGFQPSRPDTTTSSTTDTTTSSTTDTSTLLLTTTTSSISTRIYFTSFFHLISILLLF